MIIITAEVHPFLVEAFESKGFKTMYAPAIGYDELEKIIHQATGLVVTTRMKIDKNLIDRAASLKWIGRLGSGLELIDTAYASSKNIICISTPEGNRHSVAEQALGMLLNLMHKISKSSNEVKKYEWLRNENRGTELAGKTIGLVGYGNTGSSFARLLSVFDVTILAYDKYKLDFGDKLVREANLEQIARYADVISFHVPLTEETFHMGNEAFFASLKERPYILNTSRGKVIELASLVDALRENKIRGAALDVLENENLSSYSDSEKELLNYLNNSSEVIITPHIAGYSHEAFLKMSKVLLAKLGL